MMKTNQPTKVSPTTGGAPARVGRSTWVRWVLASAAGLAVGEFAFGVFSETMGHGGLLGPEGGFGDGVAHSLGLFVCGTLFGLLQWLVLKDHVDWSPWGALGSGLGLAVGFALGWILGTFPFDFLLGLLLLGLGGGISQWMALRRHVSRAGWWIAASALGFGLGGVVGLACVFPIGDAIDAAFGGGVLAFCVIVGLIGAIAGLVGGMITGSVLVRLLRRSSVTE